MLKEPLTILWVPVRSERPENTPDNQKYSSCTSWRRRNKSGGSPDLKSPGGSLTLFLYQDGRKHTLTAPPPSQGQIRIYLHLLSFIIMVICKHSHPPPPYTYTKKSIIPPTEFYPHIYCPWFLRSISTPGWVSSSKKIKLNKKFFAKMPNQIR